MTESLIIPHSHQYLNFRCSADCVLVSRRLILHSIHMHNNIEPIFICLLTIQEISPFLYWLVDLFIIGFIGGREITNQCIYYTHFM